MKTINITVDDETYRRYFERIRAKAVGESPWKSG